MLFCSYQNGCEIPFNGTPSPAPIQCCTTGHNVSGQSETTQKCQGEGGGGSGYLKTPLFTKMSKQFYRPLQVNTAYPKWTRRHTLPSRRINFKDKKSLIFDFVLSLSLSQLRAIARRHVSYRQKHQYRFFFHWGFHEDRFWVHYFFEFTSMICHCLYKILKLIRMPTTLPWGSTIWSSGNTGRKNGFTRVAKLQ